MRGTAQNPDVYFQGRETVNPSTTPRPASCRRRWTASPSSPAASTKLFDYFGAPDAERVVI
jgi:pyruvate-ferredoxin/flavodoxin oxidoreductase